MAEMSFALLEPIVNQSLASNIGPGPNLTITLKPSSPLPATQYLYPNALVVVGWHASDAEVVTVQSVSGNNTFVGTLVNAHVAGESVFSATFPTQQPTDPVFTQAEIQGYIAQAQNEFLTKVPLIFELFPNLPVLIGQVYQTVPDTAIEMERVALQTIPNANFYNIASISRTGGVVTALLSTSVLSANWTPNLPILVLGVSDNSYNSQANAKFVLATVSTDGLTLTWPQAGVNSSSSGGVVALPILTRLYESSQNQLAMQNPAWQSNPSSLVPTSFFEDRTGVYGWGIAPPPSGNFYTELLCSIRGPVALNLLDYFLVPDCMLPGIKYAALGYSFGKNGVERSPSLQRFCQAKFDYWVMLAQRFLRNVIEKVGNG